MFKYYPSTQSKKKIPQNTLIQTNKKCTITKQDVYL